MLVLPMEITPYNRRHFTLHLKTYTFLPPLLSLSISLQITGREHLLPWALSLGKEKERRVLFRGLKVRPSEGVGKPPQSIWDLSPLLIKGLKVGSLKGLHNCLRS
jgi:hypothetical protein